MSVIYRNVEGKDHFLENINKGSQALRKVVVNLPKVVPQPELSS